MKKVLILGAGNAQIDAIKYCREQGWKVYGCSYTNTDKGIPMLDVFKQIDIKDIDGIADYVKSENIDIVYSVGSDLAMPTVMRVSELTGRPHFISYEAALTCQNKNRMRAALGTDFEGNIPFVEVEHLEDALKFQHFPAMMKPTDSQGQRGCYRVDSENDIREHFEHSLSYSNEGKVIIEKFIDGPEISVNSYVVDGQLKFALVSDRIVFDDLPGGIIKEHHLPSVFASEEAQKKTVEMVKNALKKLEIKNGPAYFQIKLDGDSPVIIEVTPRLDGCHMWNLIKHYCGVDLLDISWQHLVNNKIGNFEMKQTSAVKKLKFMCEKPGVAYDRSKYDVDGAEYCFWYYETGDIVRKLNGYMEKGGYVIVE